MNCRCLLLALAAMAVAATVTAQTLDDQRATFFMGRVKYGKNHGNDWGGVGQNMVKLVSQVSTIHIRDERRVGLNDPAMFETPFFLKGHNDFVFAEIDNASGYALEHEQLTQFVETNRDQLECLLIEGLESGDAGPMTADDWQRLKQPFLERLADVQHS